MGLKALSGGVQRTMKSQHRERCQRAPSWLVLCHADPNLKGHPATPNPTPPECQEKDPPGLVPQGQAQPGGSKAIPTSQEGSCISNLKAGKPSKGISTVTDHKLPETFQSTFSIHSQSHPSSMSAAAVIVYHSKETAFPGVSCHQLQRAQGAKRKGMKQPKETVGQGEL